MAGFLLNSAVLGGIGSIVGKFLQSQKARAEAQAAKLKGATDRAMAVLVAVSPMLDERLFSMRRVYQAIESTDIKEPEVDSRWDRYQVVLVDWNSQLNLTLAKVDSSFGLQTSKRFEFEIQPGFRELHEVLNRLYRRKADRTKFKPEEFTDRADKLSALIRDANLTMLYAIEHGEVGSFAKHDA